MQLAARRTSTTVAAVVVAIPLLAGLAWLTLAPKRIEQREPAAVHSLLAWAGETFGAMWGTLGAADLVANVVVFVPIGILSYLIIPRRAWIVALLVGPVLSFAIEGVQRVLLPERVASLTDVAAASLGATIGVALAALCTLATARRPVAPQP